MKYVIKNEQYKRYKKKVIVEDIKDAASSIIKGACIGAVIRVTYEGVKFVAGKVLA